MLQIMNLQYVFIKEALVIKKIAQQICFYSRKNENLKNKLFKMCFG